MRTEIRAQRTAAENEFVFFQAFVKDLQRFAGDLGVFEQRV